MKYIKQNTKIKLKRTKFEKKMNEKQKSSLFLGCLPIALVLSSPQPDFACIRIRTQKEVWWFSFYPPSHPSIVSLVVH